MNQTTSPLKLLIIRNDKLGDFMLALPCFASAKNNLPNVKVHALVPSYTEAIAKSCQWIDKIIIDPGKKSGLMSNLNLLKIIKQQKYDAVISLFSTNRIGIITKFAGIPYRLAPATKIAQIFYNHKLVQRRSRSEKPEYLYNLDLINYFLKQKNINEIQQPNRPYLEYAKGDVEHLQQQFIQQYNIPSQHKLVFLHAGSGGSANNLSPQQFAKLANKLTSKTGHTVVITVGPGELDTATVVASELTDTPNIIFESKKGLVDFSKHIQFADVFIAGSTGPLHIAGALDTPTAGFYTHRRSATSLRWQTLNSADNRLAFSPPKNVEQEDMSAVDLDLAAKKISQKFLLVD